MEKSVTAHSADYKTILKTLRADDKVDKSLTIFNQEDFFDKLEKQISNANLSYFERYKSFKKTIVALSYLFNVASAFTAAYFVYSLTTWLTSIAFIGWAMAALFLYFLEQLKRRSSREVWFTYWFKGKLPATWLALSVALLLMSVAASYMGTDTGVRNTAPEAPVATGDQKLDDLYAEKHQIEQDIYTAQQTRWRNTITRDAQATIKELTRQKTPLQKKIDEREKSLGIEKEEVETEHQDKIDWTANVMASIVVLFEIFFEACICFIWYYYFRSYIERKAAMANPNQHIETVSHQSPRLLSATTSPPLPKRTKPNPDLEEAALVLEEQNFHEAAEILLKVANATPLKAEHKNKSKVKGNGKKKKKKKTRKIGFFTDKNENRSSAKKQTPPLQSDTSSKTMQKNTGNENRSTVTNIMIENARTCIHCDEEYIYNHKKQKYCSNACRLAAYKQKKKDEKGK